MSTAIWGVHQTKENTTGTVKIGPLLLDHKKVANEIWVRHKFDETPADTDTIDSPLPVSLDNGEDDSDWSRWALSDEEADTFRLQPVFPDFPVIVLPEYKFRLVPGAEVKIYTRIPVLVSVTSGGKSERKLTEIPTVVMAKTWFGSFTEGEMCLWLTTTARRSITDDIFKPHLVLCPIYIKNRSDEDLQIEKLALRVQRMSIFQLDGRLFSDDIEIIHKGSKDLSDVHTTGRIPVEAKGATLLAAPRSPQKKSFAERTFKILHELPGIGIKL